MGFKRNTTLCLVFSSNVANETKELKVGFEICLIVIAGRGKSNTFDYLSFPENIYTTVNTKVVSRIYYKCNTPGNAICGACNWFCQWQYDIASISDCRSRRHRVPFFCSFRNLYAVNNLIPTLNLKKFKLVDSQTDIANAYQHWSNSFEILFSLE